MADEKTFHMTPDEFRKHGHAVVDWIADYTARIESYPVLSRAEPGQVRASLRYAWKNQPFDVSQDRFESLAFRWRIGWQ